jgi:hypothetical protein
MRFRRRRVWKSKNSLRSVKVGELTGSYQWQTWLVWDDGFSRTVNVVPSSTVNCHIKCDWSFHIIICDCPASNRERQ